MGKKNALKATPNGAKTPKSKPKSKANGLWVPLINVGGAGVDPPLSPGVVFDPTKHIIRSGESLSSEMARLTECGHVVPAPKGAKPGQRIDN